MMNVVDFLREFYTWYISRSEDGNDFPNVLYPGLELSPYLSASFLSRFFEIVIRTNADPVLAAQDVAWSVFSVHVVGDGGEGGETVCRVDFGDPVTHAVRVTLVAEQTGWKITNVELA